ncbi:hypothetical protein ACFL59_11145 [Planctomycetota bacterium]
MPAKKTKKARKPAKGKKAKKAKKTKSAKKRPAKKAGRAAAKKSTSGNKCGLCGKTKNLVTTECCNQWICDDEDQYVMFSYARNSCGRNHRRMTLCGSHWAEGHSGSWLDCKECREGFETENYVWYGTNEYNFEVLPNPPEYEPTKCSECGAVIVLADGGYSVKGGAYSCYDCSRKRFPGSPAFP